jgi:hypothetical protein
MTPATIRALASLVVLAACSSATSTPTPSPDAPRTAAAVRPGEWIDLLENPGTHWRGYRQTGFARGWTFDPDTRVLTRAANGGDLITRQQFGDFELYLEWMVSPRGNSGVFFRATETEENIYESAPEVQLLDNQGHPDGQNSLTSAGANFALHGPMNDVSFKADQWNQLRLVVRGPHVEHWLNGHQVVVYDLWTADWDRKVAASKFGAWPRYGRATRGHIGLQDHGDLVFFRNIRVRELVP